MIKNPGAYRARMRQRASLSFLTPEIIELERQARAFNAEEARKKRPKRKKQPRHVRIEQRVKPSNP